MKLKLIASGALLIVMGSCENFLNEKPEINMVVPETVQDLQALLDISEYMNTSPEVLEIVSDDYYLDAADWNGLGLPTARNLYIWSDDVYKEDRSDGAWVNCYVQVNYANVVIHTLEEENRFRQGDPAVDQLLGAARFYRGKAFFEVAQVWANPYTPENTSSDLGIPLRLSPDFNLVSTRSTLEETYAQIVEDLTMAADILEYNPSEHVNRPNKCAAFAMLSRLYLTMGKFALAAEMAEKALGLKNDLLNYRDFDTTDRLPFKRFNEEVIFNSYLTVSSPIARAKVDSVLYQSYDDTDLRKGLFFMSLPNGGYGFKGNYYEDESVFFSGLTTAELFLVCAEAYMEMGDLQRSSEYLNQLLQNRYEDGYMPYNGSESNYAETIMKERRKELVFRGLRWNDVRRYNAFGYDLSMERNIDGERFVLSKGSPRFTVPIPQSVISISGMQQNP